MGKLWLPMGRSIFFLHTLTLMRYFGTVSKAAANAALVLSNAHISTRTSDGCCKIGAAGAVKTVACVVCDPAKQARGPIATNLWWGHAVGPGLGLGSFGFRISLACIAGQCNDERSPQYVGSLLAYADFLCGMYLLTQVRSPYGALCGALCPMRYKPAKPGMYSARMCALTK